ncbi:pyk [Symbiodinium natans]|uniref:Pyk protein n=1 Tax=Symbiodinium natans TaxID=878477 RepID=A0A812MF65_9DINO|nr:pyk [Symbiodinium natans]
MAKSLMVARGDLGVELELQRAPFAQKLLICKGAGLYVINATQMVGSLCFEPVAESDGEAEVLVADSAEILNDLDKDTLEHIYNNKVRISLSNLDTSFVGAPEGFRGQTANFTQALLEKSAETGELEAALKRTMETKDATDLDKLKGHLRDVLLDANESGPVSAVLEQISRLEEPQAASPGKGSSELERLKVHLMSTEKVEEEAAQKVLEEISEMEQLKQGSQINLVECHGTGTALDGPSETGALKAVLAHGRSMPVQPATVKTNIGSPTESICP